MSRSTSIAIAQRILHGPWQHASAALDACRSGSWPSFARSIAPPRPLLVGRRDHGRCLALAERPPRGPESLTLTIVPLWACSTEDAPSSEWIAVHGIREPGQELRVQEAGPFIAMDDADPRANAIWTCSVRRWQATIVGSSRSYSPEIALPLRAGEYAAVDLDVDEVLAVEEEAGPCRERPTREVPMFASRFEPRVAVPDELAAEIAALDFTAEDEESE